MLPKGHESIIREGGTEGKICLPGGREGRNTFQEVTTLVIRKKIALPESPKTGGSAKKGRTTLSRKRATIPKERSIIENSRNGRQFRTTPLHHRVKDYLSRFMGQTGRRRTHRDPECWGSWGSANPKHVSAHRTIRESNSSSRRNRPGWLFIGCSAPPRGGGPVVGIVRSVFVILGGGGGNRMARRR